MVCLLFAFFSGDFTLFVMAVIASSVVASSPVMTIVIIPQLSFHSWHPARKDDVITWNPFRSKRIPCFTKFVNLLHYLKLHLPLEFWWSNKYKTRSKKLAKYVFLHSSNPQTFNQDIPLFVGWRLNCDFKIHASQLKEKHDILPFRKMLGNGCL